MNFILAFSLLLLAVAVVLGLVKLWCGPTAIDRILAFDLVCVALVGMMVVLSIRWRTELFVELILIYSLLGFLSTVAFAFYLGRPTAGGSGAKPGLDDTPSAGEEGGKPGR